MAKIFIFLFIADLVQVFIRGRKEIDRKDFAESVCEIFNKYWFFGNIIDGIEDGIIKAVTSGTSAEGYRNVPLTSSDNFDNSKI